MPLIALIHLGVRLKAERQKENSEVEMKQRPRWKLRGKRRR
jgi:hypothetical protein